MPKLANTPTIRLAVLIDCDNARPSAIGRIMVEAAKYGAITVCRGYGDWTTANLTGWKSECNTNSIQPVQQFRYTTGKNATDSALIIDAMDLLHGGSVEGFCIVSSDGDFTRLAMRIREQGMFVMGVGKSHTPKSFVKACAVFVWEDKIVQDRKQGADVQKRKQGGETTDATERSGQGDRHDSAFPEWVQIVARAVGKAANEAGVGDVNGWVSLNRVGQHIHKLQPNFKTGAYGENNLSKLVKTRPDLFSTRGWKNQGTSNIEVRMAVSFPAAVSGIEPGKS